MKGSSMKATSERMFIKWMATYMQSKTVIDFYDAFNVCRDVFYVYLEEEKIQFLDSDYAWDEDAAKDIVDEDMSYWED